MTEFHRAKEADKKITEQINEALMTTFVSQLEREDMEILSASLYKIPKTVEKFAKRFSALKLKVIERILWAWVLTIPATAAVAFGLVWLCHQFGWI